MLKKQILLCALLGASFCCLGQVSPHETPPSFEAELHSVSQIHSLHISQPDMSEIIEGQYSNHQKNQVMPVGKKVDIEFDFLKDGTWELLPNGSKICRSIIHAEKAGHVGINFSNFYLPIGVKFFVYNESKSNVRGPFVTDDNFDGGYFSSGIVEGENIYLELIVPAGIQNEAQIDIESIVYLMDLKEKKSSDATREFGKSQDCQVNIECSEGDDWKDQRYSVVRILLLVDGQYGWCTGTIMNNSFQDCAPYILTADHCRQIVDNGNAASESDYEQWEFYFQYDGDKCKRPKEKDVIIDKLTGCKVKAFSGKRAEGGPDFLLLRLNDDIPQTSKPFYAGWDNRNRPSAEGVMIHHPAGDIKKISNYTRSTESSEWSEKKKDTHWKVYWSSTANGYGVSESGSSGSAIWNNEKRVIGQLTGGASGCKDDGTVSPTNPDYFGKMSYGWSLDGSQSDKNLAQWLDEGNSQRRYIDGIHWPCAEDPLGVESLEEKTENLQIYPNPVKEILNVDLSNLDFNKASMRVLNNFGMEVISTTISNKPITQLNLEQLGTGVYILELETAEGSIRKTIIKQ